MTELTDKQKSTGAGGTSRNIPKGVYGFYAMTGQLVRAVERLLAGSEIAADDPIRVEIRELLKNKEFETAKFTYDAGSHLP